MYGSERTKYDVPLDHLEYSYVEKCTDVSEIEKILKVLRSGVEGFYPELEATTEQRLAQLAPNSKVLRKAKPLTRFSELDDDQRKRITEDLENWSEKMKSTAETGHTDGDMICDDILPPVRGNSTTTTTTTTSIPISQAVKQENSKQKQSPMPRSYAEWDKINIDAELEKLDGDSGQKKTTKNVLRKSGKLHIPETVAATNLSDEERRQKAAREKDKGNEAFKAADFEEALVYYNRSLSLEQAVSVLNNRAQTYIKLEKWDDAIKDTTSILNKDPQNIKALMRHALSLRGLKRFTDAKRYLSKVISLDPSNKRAKEVMGDVCASLAEQKTKGRRMVIEEVEGSDDDDENEDCEQTANDPSRIKLTNGDATAEKTEADCSSQPRNGDTRPVTTSDDVTRKHTSDDSQSSVLTNGDAKQDVPAQNRPNRVESSVHESSDNACEDVSSESTKCPVDEAPNEVSHSSTADCSADRSQTVIEQTQSHSVTDSSQSADRSHMSANIAASDEPSHARSAASCSQTPVIVGSVMLPAEVTRLKQKGNELFRAGQYAEAVHEYSLALQALNSDSQSHDAGLAVLYSNRAACRQKTGDCQGCVDDCTAALNLCPGTPKVLLRRAVAYETCEKYRHAYVDFRQVLQFESQWEIAQAGATRCSQLLLQIDGPSWRERLPEMSPICMAGKPSYPSVQRAEMPPDQSSTSTSNVQNDEEYNMLKSQGNVYVQKGDYVKAIDSYTQCVKLQSHKTVGYTNRALCYVRTSQPEKAIEDCSFVLAREPKNVKALFRRAQAYKMVNRYDDSLSDLDRLLMEEKRNKAALREVDLVKTLKTKKLQEETKPKVLDDTSGAASGGRRRMHIVEVESSSDEEEEEATKPVEKTSTKETEPVTKTSSEEKKVPTEVENPDSTSLEQTTSAQVEAAIHADFDSATGDACSATHDESSKTTAATSEKISQMFNRPSASGDHMTPFEFMHQWTSLKATDEVEQYAAILSHVEPAQLPQVITNKLDARMLQKIVKCVHLLIQSGEVMHAFSYLQALVNVSRFQIIAMFLSEADKKEIASIFTQLSKHTSEINTTDLETVRKAFS